MLANSGWDLTLILLTWTVWRAPTNASKWRMGFNSAFKGTESSFRHVMVAARPSCVRGLQPEMLLPVQKSHHFAFFSCQFYQIALSPLFGTPNCKRNQNTDPTVQEGFPQNAFTFTLHFTVVTFSSHVKFHMLVLQTHRIITTNTALKLTQSLCGCGVV